MILEVSKDDVQNLLACIESTVKHAQSSLQTAATLLPLAARLSQLKEEPPVAAIPEQAKE